MFCWEKLNDLTYVVAEVVVSLCETEYYSAPTIGTGMKCLWLNWTVSYCSTLHKVQETVIQARQVYAM